MRSSLVEHLVCVTDNCNSQLDIECLKFAKDECVEGFLYCSKCSARYPIINGIPIIVEDFTLYISQRTKILGKWLLECRTNSMKQFLHEKSKHVINISQDRYEENGSWFKPYLSMHHQKAKADKHFSNIIHNGFDDFYIQISDLILDNFSNSNLCLDIGCATGTATHKLAKKLGFVIGVDQSFSFIKQACKKKSARAEFLVADSQNLPFSKNKFDLVVSLNMLDLVEPMNFIAHVSSLVRHGGNIVLTDPYDFRDEKGDPKNTHNGRSIRRLFIDNGFTVNRRTSRQSFIPWILRINKRAYLVYFADLVIAKRSV